ncbi:MAG: hypothetical protein U1E63_02080 [Burkholderiales bacterium]
MRGWGGSVHANPFLHEWFDDLGLGAHPADTRRIGSMLDTALAARLASLLDRNRFLTDPVDCYAYAPTTRKIFPPDAVAFPESTDEVRASVVA